MAWDFKNEMINRNPIVGWSKQFHMFELEFCYLLEVSNMRVIIELQQQGKIAWTFLINATMAIVSHPEHDVKLKQFEAFRDSIIAFNQRQNKTKVHMGGSYVDRIVLAKSSLPLMSSSPTSLSMTGCSGRSSMREKSRQVTFGHKDLQLLAMK